MSYIGATPRRAEIVKLDDISSSFDGSTTEFTAQVASTDYNLPSTKQMIVSLNGVIQEAGVDYTIGNTADSIKFLNDAPEAGDTFWCVIFGVSYDVTTFAGTITSGDLDSSAVTTVKIANGAITSAKLASGAVTTAKIANNAVDTNQIADDAITIPKISDNAVTTSKIANSNVTTSKIANSNVTTEKIANNAITEDKISDAIVSVLPVARGRFNMDGTLQGDDVGISSVTNPSTGNFVVTLTDEMSSSHYQVIAVIQGTGANTRACYPIDQTTTTFTIQCIQTQSASASENAIDYVNFVVFGDKA